MASPIFSICFFFFNDTATTEIYTLSLHDALPISPPRAAGRNGRARPTRQVGAERDRKSTRLNSSHEWISYAGFCMQNKTTINCGVGNEATRTVLFPAFLAVSEV